MLSNSRTCKLHFYISNYLEVIPVSSHGLRTIAVCYIFEVALRNNIGSWVVPTYRLYKKVEKNDMGKFRSESTHICDQNKLLDELMEFLLILRIKLLHRLL